MAVFGKLKGMFLDLWQALTNRQGRAAGKRGVSPAAGGGSKTITLRENSVPAPTSAGGGSNGGAGAPGIPAPAPETTPGPTAAQVFLEGLRRDVERAFGESTDPVTGVKWPPLKYRVGTPLVLTGRMRRDALAAIDKAQPNPGGGVSVVLDTPFYAIFHQVGTRRIPRRRFFGPSPATVKAANQAAAGAIVQLMAKVRGE